MPSQTPGLKIPFPLGTDRVMDGDNAMQAMAERVEARMPWGWVVRGLKTSNQDVPINTLAVVSGLSVSWVTPAIPRMYRVMAQVAAFGTAGAGQPCSIIGRLNAVNQQASYVWFTQAGTTTTMVMVFTFGAAAGTTYNLDIMCQNYGVAATLSAGSNQPGIVLVEDVGPSTLS